MESLKDTSSLAWPVNETVCLCSRGACENAAGDVLVSAAVPDTREYRLRQYVCVLEERPKMQQAMYWYLQLYPIPVNTGYSLWLRAKRPGDVLLDSGSMLDLEALQRKSACAKRIILAHAVICLSSNKWMRSVISPFPYRLLLLRPEGRGRHQKSQLDARGGQARDTRGTFLQGHHTGCGPLEDARKVSASLCRDPQ